MWDGNPAIAVTESGPRLTCGAGCLPYLVYPRKDSRLQFSQTFKAKDHRAHLYLTPAEEQVGIDAFRRYGPYVLMESTPLDRKNINRCWPSENWELLVGLLQRKSRMTILQADHEFSGRVPGVPAIPTKTFREACGLMSRARLVVCLEGGTAFGAAAVVAPAVVLWGGCVSAEALAFPEHVNLVDDSPHTPCGRLKACLHCEEAWRKITPERVVDAVQSALRCERRERVS
jgi:ADP-heptose:LPS heptosyltransferase